MGSSPSYLPFHVRLKIARGVADGLAYIHDKKHVHGNVKPSNILLTPDMDAVISDFGLDRLMSGPGGSRRHHHHHHRSSSATGGGARGTRHFGSKRSSDQDLSAAETSGSPYYAGFVGCTSPYHAPESHENLKPSAKWDVYSFGIVILELLTGRVISDRELGQWAGGSLKAEDGERILRMGDAAIRSEVETRKDAILAFFKLGLDCVSLVPQKRPSMREALQVLDKITGPP